MRRRPLSIGVVILLFASGVISLARSVSALDDAAKSTPQAPGQRQPDGIQHPSRLGTINVSCDEENDLLAALVAGGAPVARHRSASSAVEAAAPEAAVLLLADSEDRVPIDPAVLQAARAKQLHLFIERPAALSGVTFGPERVAVWERCVVASDSFAAQAGLPKARVLATHGSSFYAASANKDSTFRETLLAMARVAGYDTAVFGLPADAAPVLFVTAEGDLVATVHLSHFVTARYAPQALWLTIWRQIFARLGSPDLPMKAAPVVSPTYERNAPLRPNVERESVRRFARWVAGSGLLVTPAERQRVEKLLLANKEAIEPPGPTAAGGDGSLGILEGFASQALADGRQERRIPLRADCQAESAMALAVDGLLTSDKRSSQIATKSGKSSNASDT